MLNPKPEQPDLPKIYYDRVSASRYWADVDGTFVPINESGVRQRLWIAGLSSDRKRGPSEIDLRIIEIQNEFGADYIGRLAGWPVGFHAYGDNHLLITSEAKLIEPTYGNNTALRDFITKLLGEEQAAYMHAWNKLAVHARRQGLERIKHGLAPNFRIGQALSVIGEHNHGKTVLSKVETKIVSGAGGTKGDPSQAHTQATAFNEDLSEHEIHVLDDEGGGDSYTARRQFGESIKKSVATSEKRIHGKGKKAVTLEPFVRTVILINSRLADIRVLPPLDSGMADKLIVFKTIGPGFGEIAADDEAYGQRMDDLIAAIPDYLGWLENWEIPAEIKESRYGVASYHNPEVKAGLAELGLEFELVQLVHRARDFVFGERKTTAIKTSSGLFSTFMRGDQLRYEVLAIARTAAVFGKIMSSAADHFPDVFKRLGRVHGSAERYQITLVPDYLESSAG